MSFLRTSSLVLPLLSCVALAQAGPKPLPDQLAEKIAREGIDNSKVHAILREMTGEIGHRLTGSRNFTKACEWAKAHFEKMGLEVELEEWGEWQTVWSRGEWIGRIVEPIKLDMYVATDAWTAGTDGLQTAGFIEAPRSSTDETVAETKGMWVISRRKPTSRVRKAVEEAGALGVVYRANDPNEQYPTRVRVFGDSRVARMPIEQAPKLPEIAVRADDFDRLWKLFDEGKQPVAQFDIQNSFEPGPIKLHNVIATLPGTEKPDEWVVVSSHLDSWHQAQGCTDNGTGSATTMEAARILTSVGAEPKRSIKFCLWGGEEQGLLGSRGFVQRHRAQMPKVSACFNHDTGTNWAQSLTVTRAMKEQLEPVFAQVTRLLTPPDADFEDPVFLLRGVESIGGGRGGSDHASFLAAKVPGLGWGLKGRSDYFQHTWHTQWDTFDVAIEEYQRHTATVVAMAALGTANLPALLDRENIRTGRSGGRQSSAFASAWFGAELDGFTFKSVNKDGRAAGMGVKAGDKLVKVGGNEVKSMRQIFQFARETEGDKIQFTFQRGTEQFSAELKKEELSFGRRRRR
ncbi:MAG: M20/M25/M40 family metallo-hydrolase [Planctomycetes bacterium]|nr:M20/M25/M40 family metallo-hydrolase [Planctomycetota bacterium]